MLRRIVSRCVLAAVRHGGHVTWPRLKRRQRRPVRSPAVFTHSPSVVLRARPCTPTFCSVFNHGPCIPEIDYPIGENLQLTIQSEPARDDAAKYQRPDHDLDTIGDLFAALRACWSPPPADAARQGMQMSVLFSFKRSGKSSRHPASPTPRRARRRTFATLTATRSMPHSTAARRSPSPRASAVPSPGVRS